MRGALGYARDDKLVVGMAKREKASREGKPLIGL